MPASRPSMAKCRAVTVILAASAILSPFAARAALANHDLQRIALHHCPMRHDIAAGPASTDGRLANPG